MSIMQLLLMVFERYASMNNKRLHLMGNNSTINIDGETNTNK